MLFSRAVVQGRDALVSARVQLVNAVRGLVKSMGGRLPTSTTRVCQQSGIADPHHR